MTDVGVGSGALFGSWCGKHSMRVAAMNMIGHQSNPMTLHPQFWEWCLRAAGTMHFVTLALACVTPIPPNWDENLSRLPEVHRRFAVAQNVFIGATIAVSGSISLLFAPQLVAGTTLARVICGCIALWWGGRLFVLPWLGAHRHLKTRLLRLGYWMLILECATYLGGYGYLALH